MIIKEFYKNNLLIFHIGLIPNETKKGWQLQSNIPKEIFDRNTQKIKNLQKQNSLQRSPILYLAAVGRIVLKDSLSSLFFYPSYLFHQTYLSNNDLYAKLSDLKDGFILERENYYSRKNQTYRFFVLNQKLFLWKYFDSEEYAQQFWHITRADFEDILFCQNARLEYADLYDVNNQFYFVDDKECSTTLYLMMNGAELEMILTFRNKLS